MKKDPYAPLRDSLSQEPTHWRSLEEKAGDEALKADLDPEFPRGVTATDGWNRRDALKLGAATLALGAAACDRLPVRRPLTEILPFVKMPESVIPGVRMLYATAMQRSEGAVGLVVEAHEGRPTKIEGNPNHPASLGSSDIWAQAEILRLYDPERATKPKSAGADSSWEKWDAFAKEGFARLAAAQGAGLSFLVPEELGPTAERMLDAAKQKMPQAKVYRWDPLAPDAALTGAELAFGAGARVHYDLTKAKVIFSLDSEFLTQGPDHLKLARQFGSTRAVQQVGDVERMQRLYASEGVYSTTGANADHRLKLSSAQQPELLKALAKELGQKHGVELGELQGSVEGGPLPADAMKFVTALAKDLKANAGAALIIPGERQPAGVHGLAHALNHALGGLGATFTVSQSPGEAVARTPMNDALAGLVADLNGGGVDTLVVLDLNPAYAAPGVMKMADALTKAKTLVHAAVFPEETGAKATWHLPLAHFLESWGDARAWDGSVSLVQPLVQPLFSGRPVVSLLAQIAGEEETNDRKLLELTWRGAKAMAAPQPAAAALDGGVAAADAGTAAPAPKAAEAKPQADDKKFALAELKAWRRALHDGTVPNTARAAGSGELKRAAIAAGLTNLKAVTPSKDALELVAAFGHALDGRLTNVSWIMELPDTMSKLCWDNAVLMAPSLARELGIESGLYKNRYRADVVELTVEGRKISAPVFVLPGLAPQTLVVNQGYGRAMGEVAKGVGADVNPLRSAGNVLQGVQLKRTGATADLCSTQDHFAVPGNPFRELSFAAMTAEPASAKERHMGLGTRALYRGASAEDWKKEGEKPFREGDMPSDLVQLKTPKSRPARPIQPHGEVTYEGQQWGMVIDLSSCIGCNICAIACVAENNIPTVGREMVLLGREMHWIRIDRYFSGDIESPVAMHQPVTCMHCENAPCEPVCPVSATVHDEEGINTMAYNRCIGTRYCNNNCPYKVRRFNYLDFTHTGNVYVEDYWKERMRTLKLQRNPDVTVRYRGTMEKCTYCTQRVEEAKIAAKRAGLDRKAIPDGTITPACAQACPTQAITFGNINDEKSRVHQLKLSPRNYEMLQELNTRPRTTYLARIRNENEELSS